MEKSKNNMRLAKNTLMLYFRQFLIMLVSLYTVRVILNVLGAEDYGIYNVVAGVVTMFSFLSSAMATACQRYFSFELGRKDYEQLKKTFSVSLISYIIVAVILVVITETLGFWFVYNKLDIPTDRIQDAYLIYHSSVLSLVFTIITTPYMASIIAHEDMSIYAYVSIVEAFLKLLVPVLLPLFAFNKLVLYGYFLAAATILTTGIYRFISRRKYEECRSGWYWDKKLFKELMSYTAWNMFGSSVQVFKFQAVNIVINQFFNPVIVASRTIALQINTAARSLAQNFSTAVRPQIIKSYAANKLEEMKKLVFWSCKATFFLMYIFSLPLYLEMPYVLKLWLKTPPDYAIIFTQISLIEALIDSVSFPLMTVAQATGKIKLYQGLIGGMLLLNLPLSFASLYIGFSPVSVFIISVVLSFTAFLLRLIVLKMLVGFSISDYIIKVVFPLVVCSSLSLFFAMFVQGLFSQNFLRVVIVTISSIVSFAILMYYVSFNKEERKKILILLKLKRNI